MLRFTNLLVVIVAFENNNFIMLWVSENYAAIFIARDLGTKVNFVTKSPLHSFGLFAHILSHNCELVYFFITAACSCERCMCVYM